MQEWLTGCIMVKSDGRISADKRTTRLKLNSMRKCLRDRGPQWFGHVARIEESASSDVQPSRLVAVSRKDDHRNME